MASSHLYLFGEFCLDAKQRALFRRGEMIALTPKSLETLLFLVERHGKIADKQELMDAVWPGTFVEEASLTRNVSVLRKILSENEEGQSFIETIPKRGYRFVTPVQESAELPGEAGNSVPISGGERAARPSQGARARWATVALIAILAVGGIWYWRRGATQNAIVRPRTMLAVLPVQNLTGDPAREYVSDSLTEEMIAQLGGMNPGRLGVIARTSSMAYKGTQKTARQVGRELGVDYILEASVRGAGDRLRITTQLIRTEDQTHLWAENYDRAPGDLLTLESEVARKVADEVRLTLTPEKQARLAHPRSVNPQAYDAYLKGRYFWNKRTWQAMKSAEDFFQRAIEADPNYAPAYAGLADCYQVMVNMEQMKASEGFARAKAAARKALELDNTLAEVHTSLASIKEDYDWDWQGAEAEYKQALELNPNYATAHHWYANFLTGYERFEEATVEIKRAQELDPLSPVLDVVLAQAYCQQGRCEQGIEHLQKTLEIYPDFVEAHGALAEIYAHQRMFEKYQAEQQKETQMEPRRSHPWLLGYALAMAGHKQEALGVLREIEKQEDQGKNSSSAFIYAALGDKDRAFAKLESARQSHDPRMPYFRSNIELESLRSDSRYADLIRRMDMPR